MYIHVHVRVYENTRAYSTPGMRVVEGEKKGNPDPIHHTRNTMTGKPPWVPSLIENWCSVLKIFYSYMYVYLDSICTAFTFGDKTVNKLVGVALINQWVWPTLREQGVFPGGRGTLRYMNASKFTERC